MTSARSSDWSATRLVTFRFLFLYWFLYSIPQHGCPSIFDILPWGAEKIDAILCKPLQQLSLWVGHHIFYLQGDAAIFHPTGSGDTALDYILILNIAALTIVGTLLWSLLDRHRTNYRTLDAWLRLLLSISLAGALFEYGFAKIYPHQFGPPSLSRLTETYGDSSPMGLLWTFMGASRFYTMFGGFAEVIPGILLFFRRTRTIGALLASSVMFNIALLNFSYDVPVKIYSTHLVLLCLFLAAPDLAALTRLFFFGKQIQLSTEYIPVSNRRWLLRAAPVLQTVVILAAFLSHGVGQYQPYKLADTTAPLYGLWRVDHAQANATTTPWSQVFLDDNGYLQVKRADGTHLFLHRSVDQIRKTIALTSEEDGNGLLDYSVDPTDAHHLFVHGTWDKIAVQFEMQRINPDRFLLQTRGFHWVSEYPYNR